MIKVVLLDLDDTILDFKLCAKDSLYKASKALNIELSDTFYAAFFKQSDYLWQNVEKGIITLEELFNTRFKLLFNEFNIDCNPILFDKEYRNNLRESHILVPYAKELVMYLHQKYKVFAASNSSKGKENRLKLARIYDYFDGIFVSEEIGYPKPRIEFFLYILNKLNINKDEIVMIGDSLSSDISGAKEFNIKSIWFNKNNIEYDKNLVDIEVKSLEEIKNYL